MKSIYGDEIGTTIQFRSWGRRGAADHQAAHPWPEETAVSAGNGVVFVKGGGSYTTMFMEVYPPGASFIRGEGATPQECEDSCWEQYQRALNCPGPTGVHEWEPRGYKNGAGFCAHCGTFRSQAFTGAELGQYCHACGVGTTWSWGAGPDGETRFGCENHPTPSERSWMEQIVDEGGR